MVNVNKSQKKNVRSHILHNIVCAVLLSQPVKLDKVAPQNSLCITHVINEWHIYKYVLFKVFLKQKHNCDSTDMHIQDTHTDTYILYIIITWFNGIGAVRGSLEQRFLIIALLTIPTFYVRLYFVFKTHK